MSSPRVELMLWARRTISKKASEPHSILEIKADASVDDAQEAFHKLARVAHPDLHRTGLSAEELEIVTTAYALAAGAYQAFRNPGTQKIPKPTIPPDNRAKRPSTIHLPGGGVVRTTGATRPPPSITSTPATKPVAPAPAPVAAEAPVMPTSPATQMNSKALLQYRKAELALRQGDVRTGLLHLKMAIGADPGSTFLRAALSEVEAELGK